MRHDRRQRAMSSVATFFVSACYETNNRVSGKPDRVHFLCPAQASGSGSGSIAPSAAAPPGRLAARLRAAVWRSLGSRDGRSTQAVGVSDGTASGERTPIMTAATRPDRGGEGEAANAATAKCIMNEGISVVDLWLPLNMQELTRRYQSVVCNPLPTLPTAVLQVKSRQLVPKRATLQAELHRTRRSAAVRSAVQLVHAAHSRANGCRK